MRSLPVVAVLTTSILVLVPGFAQSSIVSVIGPAAATGNFGMRVDLGATQAYVQDNSPNSETYYYVRFSLNPSSVVNGGFDVFRAMSSGGDVVLAVEAVTGTGLQVRARLDDGNYQMLFTPLTPDWHIIELDWKAATPGLFDGKLDWKVDGVAVPGLTTLDNDTGAIDFVRWGAMPLQATTSGFLDLDDFVSTRTSPKARTFADPPPGAVIFQDGFESGDTSAWSETFPPPISVQRMPWGVVKALYSGWD